MAKSIRRKSTFGSANVDHFSPPLPDGTPKAINIVLSFEEALKLHIGFGQLLGHLNGYDRSTAEGKRTVVNLCVYTQPERITVVENKIKKPTKKTTRLVPQRLPKFEAAGDAVGRHRLCFLLGRRGAGKSALSVASKTHPA